jgi:hypothetical protein
MKAIEIKQKSLINAGNFLISIGTHEITEIAIISKSTGEFCRFSNIKKGGKLSKVKRKFKTWINSDETFTFSHMTKERTLELIEFLKK